MAYNTKSYFSNALTSPQAGADINIWDTHSSPRYAVGFKFERADGNEYVYSHFGADTAAGIMVSTDLSESTSADVDIIAPASANTVTDGTIGSKFVQATIASITADQFAGGYFSVEDDTGEGYMYRIKGNTATGDPVSGDVRFELYDPIQVALVAATTANVIGSPFANLEAATATDISAVGVAQSVQTTADKAWGWVQTAGYSTVATTGTLVIGSGCILAAAGALAPAVETDILQRVAIAIIVGATGEKSLVKLTLK